MRCDRPQTMHKDARTKANLLQATATLARTCLSQISTRDWRETGEGGQRKREWYGRPNDGAHTCAALSDKTESLRVGDRMPAYRSCGRLPIAELKRRGTHAMQRRPSLPHVVAWQSSTTLLVSWHVLWRPESFLVIRPAFKMVIANS
jgi:hypothetical protein